VAEIVSRFEKCLAISSSETSVSQSVMLPIDELRRLEMPEGRPLLASSDRPSRVDLLRPRPWRSGLRWGWTTSVVAVAGAGVANESASGSMMRGGKGTNSAVITAPVAGSQWGSN